MLFCLLFDIPTVESDTSRKGKYTGMDDGGVGREREREVGAGGWNSQGFLITEDAVAQ